MRLKHIFALMELMDLGREENTFLHILPGHELTDTFHTALLFRFYEGYLLLKLRNLLRQWVQEEVLHKLRGR